jgi:uncharacterized SAM-binding protein YcdF (DUF218 family)
LRGKGGATPMSIDAWARTLWDYHLLGHALRRSDCILVLGSHDARVAERGAEVFLEGWAPLLVMCGDRGALTRTLWDRPEAEIFAQVAAARGVPRERILVESRSTNTGENVVFARRLLADRGMVPATAIAVQKPYMERRTWATFRKQWPELDIVVTSPRLDFDAYPTAEITRDDMIQIMVGDLQRIQLYAERGFQVAQDVPEPVREAFAGLVAAGYDHRLVPKGGTTR